MALSLKGTSQVMMNARLGVQTKRAAARARARAKAAGVTLIELMVVVIIIAIFAAIAIPGIVKSSDDRKAFEKANEVAQLMQEARGRALATGSAQLVAIHANGTTPRGLLNLYEAVYNQQPISSCLTFNQWGGTTDTNPAMSLTTPGAPPATGPGVKLINGTNLQWSSDSDLEATLFVNNVAAGNFAFLCFSPGGRVYYYSSQTNVSNGAGVALSGALEFRIRRSPGGVGEGLTRSVIIDGTDTARVRSF